MNIPQYCPTPEETAECMYCRHRDNVTAFWPGGVEDAGSECPECGCVEDSPPILDEEDLARDTVACIMAFRPMSESSSEWQILQRPYSETTANLLAKIVRQQAAEIERQRTTKSSARNTPADRAE